MEKIYIAAPFFNEDQLSVVVEIESILTRLNLEFYSPRSVGVLNDMTKDERKKTMSDIYEENVRAIGECGVMIAVIEGESGARDTGTVFEVGYAVAMKDYFNSTRVVITFCREKGKNSVMLSESTDFHIDGFDKLKYFFEISSEIGLRHAIDEIESCEPEDVE